MAAVIDTCCNSDIADCSDRVVIPAASGCIEGNSRIRTGSYGQLLELTRSYWKMCAVTGRYLVTETYQRLLGIDLSCNVQHFSLILPYILLATVS